MLSFDFVASKSIFLLKPLPARIVVPGPSIFQRITLPSLSATSILIAICGFRQTERVIFPVTVTDLVLSKAMAE